MDALPRTLLFSVFLIIGVSIAAGAFLSGRPSVDDYVPDPVPGVVMECFQEAEPVPWSYCVNSVPGSDNPDVLYYLHARNGNETWWNDKDYHTGALYKRWRENGQAEPTVVAISFGKLWVLKEDAAEEGGGLYKVFTDAVVPKIEERLEEKTGQRMVAGISMGGYNALIVAMKSKGFFSKAASVCAPMPTVSHHDGVGRVIGAARSSKTSLKRALLLWRFSQQYYPTREKWLANDPLTLSASFDPDDAPALYVTCGKSDDWGCFDGTEKLVGNLEKAGGAVQWVPRDGGHCDIEYPSLAEFLQSEASE